MPSAVASASALRPSSRLCSRRKIQPPNSSRSSQARSSATASGTERPVLAAAAGYSAKVRARNPISLSNCCSDISFAMRSATRLRSV